MNQEERRQFVRDHRTCIFGYARKSDGPAMTVVYYVMNGDNELLVSTMAARSKTKAVTRDGKVSLCVLDEQWPLTYLQVYGDAVVDTDPDLAADMLTTGRRTDGGRGGTGRAAAADRGHGARRGAGRHPGPAVCDVRDSAAARAPDDRHRHAVALRQHVHALVSHAG